MLTSIRHIACEISLLSRQWYLIDPHEYLLKFFVIKSLHLTRSVDVQRWRRRIGAHVAVRCVSNDDHGDVGQCSPRLDAAVPGVEESPRLLQRLSVTSSQPCRWQYVEVETTVFVGDICNRILYKLCTEYRQQAASRNVLYVLLVDYQWTVVLPLSLRHETIAHTSLLSVAERSHCHIRWLLGAGCHDSDDDARCGSGLHRMRSVNAYLGLGPIAPPIQ